MVVFNKASNRYFDTHKGIVSKKTALKTARENGLDEVPTVNGKKRHHAEKGVKLNAKQSAKHPYKRQSYKKLYKKAVKQLKDADKKLNDRPVIVDTRFHSFLAHNTKDGMVTPDKVERRVNDYMKHHNCKLFVVAALNADNTHSLVDACGTLNDLELRGFIQRDLVPDLIEKFSDGYDE